MESSGLVGNCFEVSCLWKLVSSRRRDKTITPEKGSRFAGSECAERMVYAQVCCWGEPCCAYPKNLGKG